jgi:prephenate dehydratase
MRKVAIQGITGAYHEMAARRFFRRRDEEIEIIACNTFKDVIAEVRRNPEVTGIMAIENTIAGSLLQNHELIRESDLAVAGEEKLHITHSLAALPDETLETITEVNSHPIALMQCEEYINSMKGVKVVEGNDTASSARQIAEEQMHGHAAVCSRYAAELYGLQVLAEGIETNKRNFTRFLILVNRQRLTADETLPEQDINKASIVFNLPHTEGSLSKVLTIFHFYDLNMTKIQSLPIIGREWEYLFYVDLTFKNTLKYRQGLNAARPLTNDFKILGEYREWE